MELKLALSVFALASFAGCSSSSDVTIGVVPDSGAPADAADAITAAPGPGAFAADYKTSTSFFTAMSAPVKGTSPHGTTRIWYSSNVKDLLSQASFTVPEGTTAIKEFDMNSDGTLDGLAVMIKKPAGYDPAHGDWYYDMRDLAGNVMPDPPAGKVAMCITCHSKYKATDYLAGTKLR
ncbi:MAG: hypothetical protein IPJ34_25945 [Myxococcales bacterium]|nr:hypothetical protein [Myxococcales bacterium]